MSQALSLIHRSHGIHAYQSICQNSDDAIEIALEHMNNLRNGNVIRESFIKQSFICQNEKDKVIALCGKLKSVDCPARTAFWVRNGVASLSLSFFLGIPWWAVSTVTYLIFDICVVMSTLERNNLDVCKELCKRMVAFRRDRVIWLTLIDSLIKKEIETLINENNQLEQQDRKSWHGYCVSFFKNPSANNPNWKKNVEMLDILLKVQNLVAEMHTQYSTWLKTDMESKQILSIGPCKFYLIYNKKTEGFDIVPIMS